MPKVLEMASKDAKSEQKKSVALVHNIGKLPVLGTLIELREVSVYGSLASFYAVDTREAIPDRNDRVILTVSTPSRQWCAGLALLGALIVVATQAKLGD